jgi:branched-chain amino acid transport system ATP-binding protein
VTPALSFENVVAGYGAAIVLDGISLVIPSGTTLALLGRNGAGKTTLCETLMGFTAHRDGRIAFNGRAIERLPAYRRARLGFGYVPQQREIFSSLTVTENLKICCRPGGWSIDGIFDLFPSLRERRSNAGNHLSGGEQQMLAIGRALVGNPKILILDEPLEGLAPIVVDTLLAALDRIRGETGLTVILIEQKVELALAFSENAAVIDRGKIVHQSRSEVFKADKDAQRRLLSVSSHSSDDTAKNRSNAGAYN